MKSACYLLVLVLFLSMNTLSGQESITGFWLNESGDMVVEVYFSGETYRGRIVWLRDSLDIYGQPLRDVMNPEPEVRSRPVLGIHVLDQFVLDDDQWKDGKIYNYKTGNDYNGKISLEDRDTLLLKGYYGILFFLGKSKRWIRTHKPFDR